jgi:acyl carrier protein
MGMPELTARVRRLVAEDLLACGRGLGDAADLFEAGLDSMAIMQLMLLLEEEFGVAIPVESVTREHFRTILAVSALMRERLGMPEEVETGVAAVEAGDGGPEMAGTPVAEAGKERKGPFTRRPLKNCDFFVVSFDAMMRGRGEGGHVAHSVLELETAPDAGALRGAVERAAEVFAMLSAEVRRPWGLGVPRWEAGRERRRLRVHVRHERGGAGAKGGELCDDADAEVAFWINTPLSAGPDGEEERVRLVLVERRDGRAVLVMSWSHLLVDGKGAELLLQALDSLHRTGECGIPELEEPVPVDERHYGQQWRGALPMTWRFDEMRKHRFDCLSPRGGVSGPLRYEVRVLDEAATEGVKRKSRKFSELVNLPFQLACAMRAHDAVFAARGREPESLMCSVPVQTRRKGAVGPLFQNHLVMFFGQCLRAELGSLEETVRSASLQHQRFLREGLDRAFDDLMRVMRLVPPGIYMKFVNWRMRGLLNSFFHSDTGEFAPGMETFLGARVVTAYHVPGFSAPPGTGLFVNEKHGRLVLTQCWRGEVLKEAERAVMWERWLEDLGANERGA